VVRRAVASAVRGYGEHALSQQAAAISFRVLFSLVPLVALTVSLLELLLPVDYAERFADWLVGDLGGAEHLEDSVDRAVVGGRATASVAGLVALGGLLWAASGLMGSIRVAFQTIWAGTPRRPYVRGKVLDLVLVLATGIAVVAAFGLTVVTEAVAQLGGSLGDALGVTHVGDWLGEAIGIAASLALTFACCIVLYRFVPPAKSSWRALLVGATAGAIGFEVATVAYGWYLAKFGDLSVVYGSLGAVLGFLLVVYAGVVAMLVGAELVAGLSMPPGRR
jgi:membrane protein